MARQTYVQLVDDIDGSVIDDESGEAIEFSVSGVDYVIDLKAKNATEFHRKLDYYIEHATRVGGRKRKAAIAAPKTAASTASEVAPTKRDPEQTRAIRQWAADEGYEVNDRGRIPASIVDAFEAAH
ncbi:histone-like nucleoid-structuring protein Lsr2 [Rhodococcoides fascians]|uniref:histone-like nucleoid-structuring protein Lsr2 n=1 Tax=Rhodococcoides fascians TaxID=1828 RepID=UPI00056C269E|nr:Lsr2 family protein [Rhodococcus fascians]